MIELCSDLGEEAVNSLRPVDANMRQIIHKTTGKNEENTPMGTKGVDAWGSPRSLLLISRFLVLLERPDSQLYADNNKGIVILGFPKKMTVKV